MGGALPGDGKGLDIGAQLAEGPEILDTEDVIGGGEQAGIFPEKGMNGGLPGCRKGQALLQMGGQGSRELGRIQGGGDRPQGGQFPALTAKDEGIHRAEGGQTGHGAPRKVLGGGNGIGQRQLEDQIHPTGKGGGGPVLPGAEGGLPALDKIAAEDGHDMGGPLLPGSLNGQQMAPVQRVPFGDDGGDLHGSDSFRWGDLFQNGWRVYKNQNG